MVARPIGHGQSTIAPTRAIHLAQARPISVRRAASRTVQRSTVGRDADRPRGLLMENSLLGLWHETCSQASVPNHRPAFAQRWRTTQQIASLGVIE